MEEKELYLRIIKIAMGLLLVLCGFAFLIMREWIYPVSVLAGGAMAIVGFIWIIVSTGKILTSSKATALAMVNYFIRYLLYGVILVLGILGGLNIVSMLIGFLCVNFAIKINTYLEGKEEN